MSARYVVMYIGCLECGEPSELIEANVTLQRARELRATLPHETHWGGQAVTVAFMIDPPEHECERGKTGDCCVTCGRVA